MNNNSQAVAGNAQQAQQAAPAQHQSDMHPLYPDQAGYLPGRKVAVGAVILAQQPIEYNVGREVCRVEVKNRGDRPIQVGSHFHFFEVNRYLDFDRSKAFGKHLNIPATTAIRFEPGDSREVELVAFAGKCRMVGFNSLVEGFAGRESSPAYYSVYGRALRRMRAQGFLSSDEGEPSCRQQPTDKINKTE